MKAEKGDRIRVIRKNDEYSQDYQVGDEFTVEGTWYGGVHVTSPAGVPLSLDEDEFERADQEKEPEIDHYSYELGVMDCFCEMVASGMKTLAMSHPCDTKEERDSYRQEVEKLCRRYEILFYPEDEAFLTDLFPEELNRGKYNYLFSEKEHWNGISPEKRERQMVGADTYRGKAGIGSRLQAASHATRKGIRRYIEKTTGYACGRAETLAD